MLNLRFTVDDTPYEIDLHRVLNVEAIEAQKVTGAASWDAVLGMVDEGDASAITALVYIAMKRNNPELRFGDVRFTMEDWRSRELDRGDTPEADPTDVTPESTESG